MYLPVYQIWLIFMLFGKLSVLEMAKHWKILSPSGHTTHPHIQASVNKI